MRAPHECAVAAHDATRQRGRICTVQALLTAERAEKPPGKIGVLADLRGERHLDGKPPNSAQISQPRPETTSTMTTKPATSSTMPWRIIAVMGTWPEL